MGIENIWIFDPVRRYAWTVVAGSVKRLAENAFAVQGTPVRVPLAEINAELDEIAAGRSPLSPEGKSCPSPLAESILKRWRPQPSSRYPST
jgi:hypothetical protein